VIKQVIVLRTKYPNGKGGFFKPRLGKLAAQAAHASMKVFFDRLSINYQRDDFRTYALGPREDWDWLGAVRPWIEGIFTKIVVGCETEQELSDLDVKARAMKLPTALINDVGKTEFHGVETLTALAIGPAESDQIDKVTGHLKLL